MTPHEAEDTVHRVILRVAPDLDDADLEPDVELRRDLDLDSIDFLALVRDLAAECGVEIPESDYGRLRTVGDVTAYLVEKSAHLSV